MFSQDLQHTDPHGETICRPSFEKYASNWMLHYFLRIKRHIPCAGEKKRGKVKIPSLLSAVQMPPKKSEEAVTIKTNIFR